MDAGTGSMAGAIIGGLFGMGQGAINTNQNKKAQKRSFEMQKDLNRQGSELAYDMWQKTNYPAQVEQMKKAGLNKALMMGSAGSSGTTSAGSGGSAPQQAPTDYNVGGMAMQGIQQAMNLSLLKAQKENIEADTKSKLANATNKDANTGVQTQEEQLKNLERQFQNDTFDQRKRIYNLVETGTQIENDLKTKGVEVAEGQIRKMIADVAQGWKGLDQKDQEIKIKQFEAELKAKYPSLDSVAGGQLNNLVETLYKMTGIKDNAKKVNR